MIGARFSGKRRLKSRDDFDLLLKAEAFSNKWFVLYARKNRLEHARLGMIVSKRIMPRAISRNFVKRLIREAFRVSSLSECAVDVIIRARRSLDRNSARNGREALTQLLCDVQLKCANS